MAKQDTDISYETKTIIVILLLLFVLPAGIVLMWFWMKWPIWLKVLITVIPFLFTFLVLGFMAWFFAVIFSNPDVAKQMQENTVQNSVVVTPTGTYSSLGQSCGKNAGPAGDAQCAPGLTCYHKNPSDPTDIGTCVK